MEQYSTIDINNPHVDIRGESIPVVIKRKHDEAMKHIHFVYPVYNKPTIAEPVGICCLSSYLKERGFKVTLDDAFLKGETVDYSMEIIKREKPPFIGISINSKKELEPGLNLAYYIKQNNPDTIVIVGGMVGTLSYENILENPNVDYVVIGDGEITLENLLGSLLEGNEVSGIKGVAHRVGKEIIHTGKPTSPNLGLLPPMDREYLRKIYSIYGDECNVNATIINTRGCVGSCNFCAVNDVNKHQLGKKVRFRDVDLLVDEIESIVKEFGISDFYFSGSIFLPGGKFGIRNAQYFRDKIKERNLNITFFAYLRPDSVSHELISAMKDAGMRTVFIGVESFNDEMLQSLEKGLTKEEILNALEILHAEGFSTSYNATYRLKIGFITFTPFTTREELQEQIQYVQKFKIPAKKLTYMWDVFSEWKDKTIRKGAIDIHDGYSSDILAIHSAYKNLFSEYKSLIEEIRSLQKTLGEQSDLESINTSLYGFLDEINELFYRYFETIVNSTEKNYPNLMTDYRKQIESLIVTSNIGNLLRNLKGKVKELGLDGVFSFRFKRATENPQIE